MKTLYEAANAVEAHMILNLLEQQELNGRVEGEYLQGGIGELPATGLVRVMVDENDYEAAREIVRKWDNAQSERDRTGTARQGMEKPLVFVAGMVFGILLTILFFLSRRII